MHKLILGMLTFSALIIGASLVASASPASPLLRSEVTVSTAGVQHADYYWNHHRYKHRSWDKRRRRWRYY